ncbi:hypothetical protein BD289DRAFT_154618 [Coniella lustricola]|uniref:Secreted protein n=1 Tax=Coniella lustricola TaxID=2025994 RepID=A0A2T3AMD7_9PEZI|nr:hypothetical protein BD289DRAFT_154618 [Coniella lustricola]
MGLAAGLAWLAAGSQAGKWSETRQFRRNTAQDGYEVLHRNRRLPEELQHSAIAVKKPHAQCNDSKRATGNHRRLRTKADSPSQICQPRQPYSLELSSLQQLRRRPTVGLIASWL